MPELTVTPFPESEPPSVRVRVDADEDTLITRAQVRRDGEIVRGQVADRTPRLVIDDYEMPYATEVEYSVEGESVPTDVPLIDEDWDDLGAWSGDTGDWDLPTGVDPVAINLVTDPLFQSDEWESADSIPGSGANPADVEASATFGQLLLTKTGDDTSRVMAAGNQVPVSVGDEFTFSCRVRSQGFTDISISATALDSSGSSVGNVSASSAVSMDGAWHELTAPPLSPVPDGYGITHIVPMVTAWSGFQGAVAEIEAPILTRGADPVDFFTGDSDDTGRWHYEWSGVPGESTSLKFDKDSTPTLHSDVDDAAITHTTDVPFNTVTVENPLDVMVELIDVVDTEDGEESNVAVTIRSTGSGTTVQCHESGTVRTNGGGTYTASVMDGTLEVSGDAWTLDLPCTAEPSRIRVTAMPAGHHYLGALDTGFELGSHDRIAVSDAYVFVLNYDEETVYRFDHDGGNPTSWALSETAVDIVTLGSNVYTLHDDRSVTKWTSDGTLDSNVTLTGNRDVPAGTQFTVSDGGGQFVVWYADSRSTMVAYRSNGAIQWVQGRSDVSKPWGIAPSSDSQIVWTAAPDASAAGGAHITRYSTKPNGKQGPKQVWASDAIDLDTTVSGVADSKWSVLKYELWGDRVRVSGGYGQYTGTEIKLNGTARQIAVNDDGTQFYTVEGNRIAIYGPLAEVGHVAVRAIDAQVGEEFSLSQTVTVDAQGAWLIHTSNPTALSVNIDRGQHRYDHQGVNVAGASASEKTSESNVTVHHAPGAEYAVVNRWGVRPRPTWTLSLQTETWAARDQVSALLKDQQPVLFRAPEGWQWDLPDGYYSVGDVSDKARIDTRADLEGRLLELPLTAVKRPAVVVSPSWTYNSVLVEFGSLEALEQSGVSWLELLLGDV